MAKVSTYLNFPGNAEAAFNFYKSVFGGEFGRGGAARFSDIPPSENIPSLAETEKNLIMHVELEITGGHTLMGSDVCGSMGSEYIPGNNLHISLETDTREETNQLFEALSKDGKVGMELRDMFWGAYFGSCTDKFGVSWMFNCPEKT